jgi:hypothetical protein
MRIALDYDDTYTRDPGFWNGFIAGAKSCGHEVVCVTMRYETEADEVRKNLGGLVHIFCTGRRAKKPFMERLRLNIDVWIDDTPFFVNNSAIPDSPSWPN